MQGLGEARADGPKPPLEITVEESGSASAFLALRQEWNALVERSGARLFERHECIRAWLVGFAPAARLVVLTARDPAGRLVAVLPLVAETGVLCGLPARQLVAAANTHSCRFEMSAEDPPAAGPAFLAFSLRGRALRALKFGRGRAAYEWLDGWRARLAPGRARKGRSA